MITDVLVISVLQVVGQISTYYIVFKFKQHIFPLISTTRKMFTVLLSIVIFGHALSGWQWITILIIFAGITYELSEELQQKTMRKQ